MRILSTSLCLVLMWASWTGVQAAEESAAQAPPLAVPDDLVPSFHLIHPGADSIPGDPNAAFYLDGTYHLHYILGHPWHDGTSFSFIHVTSPDMLHWTWQPTKLQPSFTGHGMFSGTGFLTKEGQPAVIYHGQGSDRNQIAVAKDRQLSDWEKPYPIEAHKADGRPAKMSYWDPDCFLIGDTYYAISGGEDPPLMKSKDLKDWTYVGKFLQHNMPDVAQGEDISCANFFPLGKQWMLLCISHNVGCRYYLGDWDAEHEQFVPQRHGRMNFRRESQSLFGMSQWRIDFFAPESLLTPDGRRVMWAWLATVGQNDGKMSTKTIQSLPRELSLADDGTLRIAPLRELDSLRQEGTTRQDIEVPKNANDVFLTPPAGETIATLPSDAQEIRLTISHAQAARKLFGFTLFSDGKEGGLPILFRPETGTIRLGNTEAPFSIAALPENEDLDLRIYVDKYLVEVFVNGRQALVTSYADFRDKRTLRAFTVGAPLKISQLQTWSLQPTTAGFWKAREDRLWEPDTK